MWRDTGDVIAYGFNHGLYIAGLVGAEPVAVVVFLQVIKEAEEILAETAEFNNKDTCSENGCRNTGSASSKDSTGRSCNTSAAGVQATGS